MLVVGSKADLPGATRALAALRRRVEKELPGVQLCAVSSLTGSGLTELQDLLRGVLQAAAAVSSQDHALEGNSDLSPEPLMEVMRAGLPQKQKTVKRVKRKKTGMEEAVTDGGDVHTDNYNNTTDDDDDDRLNAGRGGASSS